LLWVKTSLTFHLASFHKDKEKLRLSIVSHLKCNHWKFAFVKKSTIGKQVSKRRELIPSQRNIDLKENGRFVYEKHIEAEKVAFFRT